MGASVAADKDQHPGAEADRERRDAVTRDELASLLASTGIAVLLLDESLRVRRYTAAATRLFDLTPGDLGRPIGEVARSVEADDLTADAVAVMRNLAPCERQVRSGSRWFAQRVLPHRIAAEAAPSVVVTYTDVTELVRAHEQLSAINRELEERIEERARLYRLIRDCAALANRGDAVGEMLRGVLGELCSRAGWALAHVYYYDSPTVTLLPSSVWLPEDAVEFDELAESSRTVKYAPGEAAIGRVFETGHPEQVDDLPAAMGPERRGLAGSALRRALLLPVTAGDQRFGVLELYSTDPEHSPPQIVNAMLLVAREIGQALLRKQTESIVSQLEASEQQRIGQDLHDGLGQLVSAVGMLAHGLLGRLEARGAEEAEAARRLVESIENAKQELRGLVRGLMPVYSGGEGLVDALERLVDESEMASGIPCLFETRLDHGITDNFVARHLYYVAQEAVRNALQHAEPTRVEVRLEQEQDLLMLSIRDDGRGLPAKQESGGSGLRIMRHRAALMAARLVVESEPGGGTSVACRLRVGARFRRDDGPR